MSRVVAVALWSFLIAACGGDDDPGGEPGAPDAAPIVVPDASADSCDEVGLLSTTTFAPVDKVTADAVTVTTARGVHTAVIDARAGGPPNARENPYIYVNLATAQQVAISDTAALTSTDWHLAFKRFHIRVNGGDSGAGGNSAAYVEAQSLDAVTAAPDAAMFAVDDWSSAGCTLVAGQINDPITVMSSWYDRGEGAGASMLVPHARVYVIRTAAGAHYKVRIVNYYTPSGAVQDAAKFTIEWTTL